MWAKQRDAYFAMLALHDWYVWSGGYSNLSFTKDVPVFRRNPVVDIDPCVWGIRLFVSGSLRLKKDLSLENLCEVMRVADDYT